MYGPVEPPSLSQALSSPWPVFHSPHPSHISPRSLNRRQSIALQSSFSGHLPVTPLQNPPPLTRPHTLYSFTAADRQNHADGAKSLSYMAPRVPQTEYSAVRIQRDRRRSMAYERYPPLGSIFEFNNGAESSSHTPNNAATGSGIRTTFPSLSADSAAADYFQPMPLPLEEEPHQMCRSADAAFPDHPPLWPSGGDHGLITFGSHNSVLNQHQHGISDEKSTASPPPEIVGQGGSSTSLASSVFSVDTFSSSSSAASSYAYIFDSARPLRSSVEARAVALHLDFEQPASAATATTAAVIANPAKKRRYASRNNSSTRGGRGRSRSTLFAIDRMIIPAAADQAGSQAIAATEYTPLLAAHGTDGNSGDSRMATMSIAAREVRTILAASSHLFIGSALQAVISMSQIASSGHLGRNELAGIGLAHMVVILTGYPVAFSVLSCFETCASQAFTSTQPWLVGGYFIRALQIQWILGLVLGTLWFSAEPLLTFIFHGTNPIVVEMAMSYLRWYFVPFMVFANFLCAKQVLYAQGITYPLPYLTFIGAVATLAGQYLFVFSPYFSLGVRGIALGNGLSYLVMLIATLWIIYRHDVQRIWSGPLFSASWQPFLRLLPPCLALALFSTGTSELITIAATQLGARSLATQSVLSALARMFMIAFSSIGISALNRTGNLIGMRSVRGAKVSANVSLLIGLVCAILAALAMLWSPEMWIRIITNDAQVIEDAQKVLPMAILAFAAQSTAFVGSQLLSAQGRQSLAVGIKFVTLYAIGVPLGYYWAIASGYGLFGLWAAVAVGQLCTGVAEAAVVLGTNWIKLVDSCTESIIVY
ncbi:ethionine resistance protein [Coemansia sp. RSA 2607]|nr:ethionine resistance protein [Coemansia sp. RSA 2607]